MSCLFCVNYVAIEPEQHRQQRLAGSCPDGCGGRAWGPAMAMAYVRRTNENLAGECHVSAQTQPKKCADICGQFQLSSKNLPYDCEVTPRPAGQNLHEWANQQIYYWIHGWPKTLKEQRLEYLEHHVASLKRELAAARKHSAARWERIKKLEAQKKPKQQLPKLRLVPSDAPAPMPMTEAAD